MNDLNRKVVPLHQSELTLVAPVAWDHLERLHQTGQLAMGAKMMKDWFERRRSMNWCRLDGSALTEDNWRADLEMFRTEEEIWKVLGQVRGRSDEEIADWEASQSANEARERLRKAGLDTRELRSVTLSPQQAAVYRTMAQLCRGVGSVVVLCGRRGPGKTTMASVLVKERIEAGLTATYAKFQSVFEEFLPLYDGIGRTNVDGLRHHRDRWARSVGVRVLDEVHEPLERSPLALSMLTDIVDRRYRANLDTVLITNKERGDLFPKRDGAGNVFEAGLGGSLLSRISEHGMVLECDWESFRERGMRDKA